MRPIKGSPQPNSSQSNKPPLHKSKKNQTQVSYIKNNNNNNIPNQNQTQNKNKNKNKNKNMNKNKKAKVRHEEEVMEPRPVLIDETAVIKKGGGSDYFRSTSSAANADGFTSADYARGAPSFSDDTDGETDSEEGSESEDEQVWVDTDGNADPEKGSQSEDEQDVVYADFEFFDPKQDDYHGVRNLLKTYCEGMNWDLSGFVDILLAQTTVGTVIKTDEDSLFGFITALNLARYKDHRCIMDIQKFLLDKSLGKAEKSGLRACLEEHPQDVGLLVCERVVNLPFELIPPLYDALFDEVSWATEDEPTPALRDFFQFKHYLILTKVYQTFHDMRKESKEEMKLKKKKKRKNDSLCNEGNGNADKHQIIYIKPEDEIFHQLCSWSFKFPVDAEYQATHEFKDLKTMCLVMAVKVKKIPTFRNQLKALIDES